MKEKIKRVLKEIEEEMLKKSGMPVLLVYGIENKEKNGTNFRIMDSPISEDYRWKGAVIDILKQWINLDTKQATVNLEDTKDNLARN